MIRYSLDKRAPGMFASDHGAYVKIADMPAIPKLMGVSRGAEEPRALCLFFAEEPTDDQLRNLHDFLTWMSETP